MRRSPVKVANSLLQEVGRDPYLQTLLRKHGKNFENALSEVQREFIASPNSEEARARLNTVQGAIGTMFTRLNQVFERNTDLNFSNEVQYSVCGFLTRFDALFSLNQDLLLELQYAGRCPPVFEHALEWPPDAGNRPDRRRIDHRHR